MHLCNLINITGIFLLEPVFSDVPILNYFGYLFRDVLPMVLKIILNSILVYLVRKHVKNKVKVMPSTAVANSSLVIFDRKQTYVALEMSTFSLPEHMLYITSNVLYFLNDFYMGTVVIGFVILFIAVKHLLSFLLLFNKIFRNEVKTFFKLNHCIRSTNILIDRI